jgi:hypothetical protein
MEETRLLEMKARLRVARLRRVAVAVDRLPRSSERDRLLRTLRSRVVDLETEVVEPSGWRGGCVEEESDRDALDHALSR